MLRIVTSKIVTPAALTRYRFASSTINTPKPTYRENGASQERLDASNPTKQADPNPNMKGKDVNYKKDSDKDANIMSKDKANMKDNSTLKDSSSSSSSFMGKDSDMARDKDMNFKDKDNREKEIFTSTANTDTLGKDKMDKDRMGKDSNWSKDSKEFNANKDSNWSNDKDSNWSKDRGDKSFNANKDSNWNIDGKKEGNMNKDFDGGKTSNFEREKSMNMSLGKDKDSKMGKDAFTSNNVQNQYRQQENQHLQGSSGSTSNVGATNNHPSMMNGQPAKNDTFSSQSSSSTSSAEKTSMDRQQQRLKDLTGSEKQQKRALGRDDY